MLKKLPTFESRGRTFAFDGEDRGLFGYYWNPETGATTPVLDDEVDRAKYLPVIVPAEIARVREILEKRLILPRYLKLVAKAMKDIPPEFIR